MTNQVPETIYYQGEKLDIYGYPALPKKDARVIYIEGYQGDPYFDIPNMTMCWRRYIGTWRIEEGKLYLCHFPMRQRSCHLNGLRGEQRALPRRT